MTRFTRVMDFQDSNHIGDRVLSELETRTSMESSRSCHIVIETITEEPSTNPFKIARAVVIAISEQTVGNPSKPVLILRLTFRRQQASDRRRATWISTALVAAGQSGRLAAVMRRVAMNRIPVC